MKNSNIAWIGQIPDNWKLERFQWHLDEIKESNDPVQTKQILSLTNKLGVIPYEEKGEQGNKAKEDVTDYKLAYPNTIVANSMNVLIGSVGKCNYFGCVSPVYYVFKPKEKENIDFINYVFQTEQFQKELRRFANGILEIRLRVSSSDILKREIAFPSVEVQKKIVDFLNKKCSEIDKLIELENKQIENLKEYKQAVIDNKMSELPDKIQIKYISSINGRIGFRGYKQEDLVDEGCGAITLSPSNLQNLTMNYGKCHYLSWFKYNESPEIQISTGDILFVKTGSSYGKSAIVDTLPMEATINPQLLIFKNIKIDHKYFLYALQTNSVKSQIEGIVIGGTIPTISQEKIGRIVIKNCDIEVQRQIVLYLDNKCSEIDSLIEIKNKKIEELQQYKKSIIYEYVTGKKEV